MPPAPVAATRASYAGTDLVGDVYLEERVTPLGSRCWNVRCGHEVSCDFPDERRAIAYARSRSEERGGAVWLVRGIVFLRLYQAGQPF